MNVLLLFKNIRCFILDVDGVLTDGSLLVLDDGQQVRKMNIKDGYALQLAIKKGYHILIVSGGSSAAVKWRLEKLGIENIHFNVKNKAEVIREYVTNNNLTWPQVLYMGDDMPDHKAMQMAGLACCPTDAVPEIKAISHYTSDKKGGEGCVRDVLEKTMKLNGHWTHEDDIVSQ